jgi:hypothetical protein
MRNAGHHAFEDAPVPRTGLRIVERSEAKRVHDGDRPRAHREDVAKDSADAGRCALERFDEAGVVVRLDLERDRIPMTDIDDAGIFARPHQHMLAARRQLAQVQARALVGAMLAPHHAEDAEFGVGGLAAQQ